MEITPVDSRSVTVSSSNGAQAHNDVSRAEDQKKQAEALRPRREMPVNMAEEYLASSLQRSMVIDPFTAAKIAKELLTDPNASWDKNASSTDSANDDSSQVDVQA
jgi:hypothetical protein